MNVRKYVNPNPQIRWTVAPDTVDNLFKDVIFFVEHGFTNLAIDPVYEVEWKEEDIEKYVSELKKIGEFICEASNPVLVKPFQDLSVIFSGQSANWKSRCGLGQGGIGMDIFGRVFVCHRAVASQSEDLIFGDLDKGIDEERRKAINEKYWNAGKPVSEDGAERCSKCLWYPYCFGGCLMVNYDVKKSMNIVPRSYCKIIERQVEELLPLVLRMRNKWGSVLQPRW
jgi:radical SAM protein with 4Fe4S-binding SPASM domain